MIFNNRFLYTILITITLFCSFAIQASAQKKDVGSIWQTATDGSYTYRYVAGDPMHARFYKLKNGLTVILSVNKKEPLIRTLIGVRAGSNNDPKDHTGLAHYLEHLLFKGTTKFGSLNWTKEKPYIDQIEGLYASYNATKEPSARKRIYHLIDSISGIAAHYAIANEYDKLMSAIGGTNSNAHTATEETVYEESIPANTIDQYLAIQSERFRAPVFRLFHTELEAVYEEKNRTLDEDAWKVNEALNAALYPTSNYGQQTTIGTIEHLKNPSLKAIREFYDKWYVPNNMAIVMAGDLNPSATIRKIDQAFSWMKVKPITNYRPAPERPIFSPVVRNVYGPSAESVTIAFRTPGPKDAQSQLALEAAADILSNGRIGLIDVDLKQTQRLQSASASNEANQYYGTLTLNGSPKPGQTLEKVKDLLLAEVAKLRNGDFDHTMLQPIVSNIKLGQQKSLDNDDYRATQLMHEYIESNNERWTTNVSFLNDLSKVTKTEVQSFAKQWLNSNYVLIYKRQGKDSVITKVEKPIITPVFINKGAQSNFFKQIAGMPKQAILPVWSDPAKAVSPSSIANKRFLYVQNTENKLFRLSYRIKTGSYGDLLLPLAAQYLVYLGTKDASHNKITREFYDLACDYQVAVQGEETIVTIGGLSENFTKATSLLENLLRNCQTDTAALTGLKDRILKGGSNAKLSKQNIAKGLMMYARYGAHNPFNTNLTDAQLKAIAAEQLINKLHQLLDYDQVITYYGPLNQQEAVASIQKLHPIAPPSLTAPVQERFTERTINANEVLFANYDMVQAEIYWLHNLQGYDPKLSPAIDIFNNYFGGGMNAIVFQTIRESKALAYSTYAQYATADRKEKQNYFVAYAGTQADKLKETVASMNELLTELPENEILFNSAKQAVRDEIATDRVQPADQIGRLLAQERLGLSGDPRKFIYDETAKLTFSDIKNLHRQAAKERPFSYCIVGSSKHISKQDLEMYGTFKQLTLEEIFGY